MDIWPQEDTPQYTYSEAFRNLYREMQEAKAEARELRDILGRLHAMFVMLAEVTRSE